MLMGLGAGDKVESWEMVQAIRFEEWAYCGDDVQVYLTISAQLKNHPRRITRTRRALAIAVGAGAYQECPCVGRRPPVA